MVQFRLWELMTARGTDAHRRWQVGLTIWACLDRRLPITGAARPLGLDLVNKAMPRHVVAVVQHKAIFLVGVQPRAAPDDLHIQAGRCRRPHNRHKIHVRRVKAGCQHVTVYNTAQPPSLEVRQDLRPLFRAQIAGHDADAVAMLPDALGQHVGVVNARRKYQPAVPVGAEGDNFCHRRRHQFRVGRGPR